ncbi:hypothetical protein [Helicobacter rodentium]|nr:hypothetical protein [Helicobacter rodentium]
MTKFYEKLNALCKEILSKSPPPRAKSKLRFVGLVAVAKAHSVVK